MISFNIILFSLITSLLITILCIYFFKKKKIFLDEISYSNHKELILANLNRPPLCGGIIIFICSLFFFENLNLLKIFGFGILLVGILSDINKITSPKVRILLQLVIIIFFVSLSNSNINNLSLVFLNNLLNIHYISIVFTAFCFLILINGTNFLDGLNTLVIGYYLLVLGILIFMVKQFDLYIDHNVYFLFTFLISAYVFNFFEKIYLGDSGSYFISFVAGYLLIDFVLKNSLVSPYFICLLLWYPAFENLLSILRRISLEKKVHRADQLHLHHLLFKYFVKKNFFKNKFANSISANLINLYNLLVFILFYKYFFNTKVLVVVVIFNLVLYLALYTFMKKRV